MFPTIFYFQIVVPIQNLTHNYYHYDHCSCCYCCFIIIIILSIFIIVFIIIKTSVEGGGDDDLAKILLAPGKHNIFHIRSGIFYGEYILPYILIFEQAAILEHSSLKHTFNAPIVYVFVFSSFLFFIILWICITFS